MNELNRVQARAFAAAVLVPAGWNNEAEIEELAGMLQDVCEDYLAALTEEYETETENRYDQ